MTHGLPEIVDWGEPPHRSKTPAGIPEIVVWDDAESIMPTRRSIPATYSELSRDQSYPSKSREQSPSRRPSRSHHKENPGHKIDYHQPVEDVKWADRYMEHSREECRSSAPKSKRRGDHDAQGQPAKSPPAGPTFRRTATYIY